METITLIKWLEEIDSKLRNRFYKEQKTFIGKLSGVEISLPAFTRNRYNPDELCALFERKGEIINELYNRKVIDDEGYEAYMMSESCEFTPKLILSNENKR